MFRFFGLVLLIAFCKSQHVDELQSVVVIFRHGDRTPIDPYPTDPYKNISFWPEGFGQLTNAGKLRHYKLGQWLRERYKGFLPEQYSLFDFYARSSDVDRTLMSAEANIAGLFPPKSSQVWDLNMKWQPIPIHTEPEFEDPVLAMKKPCPKYSEMRSELLKTPYFKEVDHKIHDLYAYLTRYSGNLVSTLQTLEYLYGTLLVEQGSNLTLPAWTKPVFPDKMRPWAELSFAVDCYTPELARLKTGPLFNEIIQHFDNITQHAGNTYQKFKMYSGHDVTIANVLNSMGAFEYHAPPYASMILFELKRNTEGYYVNIFYKNSTVPRKISVRGCDFNCSFEDFKDSLRDIAVDLPEWHNECLGNAKHYFYQSSGFVVLVMISLWAVLLLIVIGLYAVAKYFDRAEAETSYMKLPSEDIA